MSQRITPKDVRKAVERPTITVTLEGVRRLNNSVNGNPRFELHTDQGTFTTASDASWNYEVTNYRLPTILTLTLTRAGRVTFGTP